MAEVQTTPRRVRVESGIYIAPRNGTQVYVYEVGYYDEKGHQRWKTVDGGIEEARALRKELHIHRSYDRRERADLVKLNRMAKELTPSKRTFRQAFQATQGANARQGWLMVAALALARARMLERPVVPDEKKRGTKREHKLRCQGPTCTIEFVAKRSDAKYCSPSCRTRAAKHRTKEDQHA